MSRRNKSDNWVSLNKLLNSSAPNRQAGRNPNFETEETKLLISLWGRPEIQRVLITSSKKLPIIQNLAKELEKHGFKRSPEEINTRIKNLKCFYNRMKKDIELGILREPTWRHYDSMKKVLDREVFGNNRQIADKIRRNIGLSINDELEALKKSDYLIVPKAEPMDWTQPEIKIEVEEDFPLIVESDTPMVFPTNSPPKVPQKIIQQPKSFVYMKDFKEMKATKQPPPLSKNIPVPTKNSTMKVIFVNKLPPKNEVPKIDATPKQANKPPEEPEQVTKGVQSLLKELLEQQKQQMEIEQERLELEKERFKFEKEIGEKLLEVLPAILELTKKLNQLEDEDVDI